MFDSSLIIGEDICVQPSRYEEGKNHTLRDIFSLLAQGWTSKKIRQTYPDVLPETIAVSRAVLIGRNKDFFPDTKKGKPFQDFKVLIDENITPEVKSYLKRHFKKVSHVSDVGLVGAKDDQAWKWSINNSYDVIFTKDRANKTEADLTYAAIDEARGIIRTLDESRYPNMTLSALPLLVHLSPARDVEVELKKLFRRRKEELFSYFDNRATPYVDTGGGNILCGPTYFELRAENQIKDKIISVDQIRARKTADKLHYRAMIYSQLTTQQKREMTAEQEKKIDDQVNAAVGMGSDVRSSPRVLPHCGLGVISPHSWLP